MYQLTSIPFSCYGSWFGVVTNDHEAKAQKLEGDILLRSYHSMNCTFASLVPMLDGEPCEVDISHDGAVLTISNGDARIECCFESASSLRIRGEGMGLRLVPLSGLSYPEGKNAITLNAAKALRRYRFEALQGELVADGFWSSSDRHATAGTIDVAPTDDGVFGLVMDEYASTWAPRGRGDFRGCCERVERELHDWIGGLPEAPVNLAEARQLAGYIDWSCVVSPTGLIKRNAMFMSKNWMCNIWSWDNCFNAIAMVPGHPQLAMDQLLVFVDHQDEFGAYPDYMNDINILPNFCKPPIHGWTVAEMLKRKPDLPQDFIESIYDSLARWSNWWLDHRRLEGQKLPYYLHGNDSGWDNSTLFDDGVPLVSPDLSAFLAVQLDVVSDLAAMLGDRRAADEWKAKADELVNALMAELWDGSAFRARHGFTGEFVESRSLIQYMPVLLGGRLPEDVVRKLAAGVESCLTEWGPATEPPDSPEYDSNGYWRGPIWAPSTCLIVSGLQRCDCDELAREIAERFCRMCSKSGMAENYDAVTGESLCDPAYSWTSSVFLLLADLLKESGTEGE